MVLSKAKETVKDIYGEFYNPTRLLSTGKPYLISIGVRSAGKSTGFLIHLLKEWMFKGKQFIYIRRTKDELDETAPNAFNNAVTIYNHYYGSRGKKKIESVEYKAGTYLINGQLAGYAIPLSLQNKYKSLPFENVWYMFYDEALISRQGGRYLGTKENPYMEAEALMSLFITVDRGIGEAFRNELTTIIVGNNEVYTSPIFMRLGIDEMLTRETKFLNPKHKPWAVEQTYSVDALADAKQSNAYALSSDYNKAYAFEGGVFDKTFIGLPLAEKVRPLFNIVLGNSSYGVYQDGRFNLYVSHVKCRDHYTFVFNGADHRPDYTLVKEVRNNAYMKMLRECYMVGRVRFSSARARYMIDTLFGFDK